MSNDENKEERAPMFPNGWEIERKPTIEMRIKAMFKKLIGRG